MTYDDFIRELDEITNDMTDAEMKEFFDSLFNDPRVREILHLPS